MGTTEKSIFSRIIDREIPAKIEYEDDQAIAFFDIHPQAPVHLLVVPKKPLACVDAATREDTNLLGHLLFVAGELAKRHGISDGYRLVINNGERAGQSVFHLHVHVLGGRAMGWPPG